MGNTDILTTSLPDADTENTTEHSTIFDDVFRTIAQKMPQLLIPLINEVSTLLTARRNSLNNCETNITKSTEP